MAFKASLKKFLDNAEARAHPGNPHPPPIPTASKPPPPNRSQMSGPPARSSDIYWRPDFNPSIPVSRYFEYETGQTGWGNNEAQNYTESPENSFFTPNGLFVIRAIAQSSAPERSQKYTSARFQSNQRLSRQQGCFTFRATAPSARGIWPAIWMMPEEPCKWPEDGEVDIFEAWNGDPTNHSCLHWGNYNGQDWNKHRVVETPVPDLGRPDGKVYAFAWHQSEEGKGGQMIWYIEGQPVMRATIPEGTRRMSEWRIIINVAMGGNVCQGQIPADGVYDLVIHEMRMETNPPHGWSEFQVEFQMAKEGHAM